MNNKETNYYEEANCYFWTAETQLRRFYRNIHRFLRFISKELQWIQVKIKRQLASSSLVSMTSGLIRIPNSKFTEVWDHYGKTELSDLTKQRGGQ